MPDCKIIFFDMGKYFFLQKIDFHFSVYVESFSTHLKIPKLTPFLCDGPCLAPEN